MDSGRYSLQTSSPSITEQNIKGLIWSWKTLNRQIIYLGALFDLDCYVGITLNMILKRGTNVPSKCKWQECHLLHLCHIPLAIFFYYLFLFIFWLHWVFVAARGLSLVTASRGYSSLRCAGFSLQQLLLLRSTGSRCVGFSSCGTWAQ